MPKQQTGTLRRAVRAEVQRQLLAQKLARGGRWSMREAHKEINFSPFAQNVLDYVGRNDLVTRNGKPVQIKRAGMGFEVIIDGRSYGKGMDNIEASYVLNSAQVGLKESVREAKDLKGQAKAAKADMSKVRSGTLDAERYIGYVRTELESIGREHNNSTATALARDASAIQTQLGQINKKLEKIGQQLTAWS